MKTKIIFQLGITIISTLFFTSCKKNNLHFCDGDDTIVTTTKVYATGLNNPRGLKFGPDGYLYVAEGGLGGTNSTTPQQCQQVPSIGPYTGSPTGGRISKIDRHGHRTTVTDALPSSQSNPQVGSLVAGVADVAFIDHTMYALLAGAGCSHGVLGTDNAVMRIAPNGSATMIANLSAYQKTH